MDKERELSLMAPIKTTMMLLVVLYHSCVMWAGGGWFDYPAVPCTPLGNFALWLNTFHVPMFVFASGYVHSYLRRETPHYGSTLTVLARKARRLLLPCFLVSLLWAAPMYGAFFGAGDLAGKFLLMESPSQLWFLPMLFWCFAVTELIWKFFRGLILQPDARVFSAVALLAIGSPIVSKLTGGAFQLSSACSYLILFYSGWVFRMGGDSKILDGWAASIHYRRSALIRCLDNDGYRGWGCRFTGAPRSRDFFASSWMCDGAVHGRQAANSLDWNCSYA